MFEEKRQLICERQSRSGAPASISAPVPSPMCSWERGQDEPVARPPYIRRALHRLLLAAPIFLAGCAGELHSDESALSPAGPQAGRISGLFWLFFWVCVAVYVLVMLFLLLAFKRPGK